METTSKSSTSGYFPGLPDSIQSELSEMIQSMREVARMEAAIRRKEIQDYRIQKFNELVNGKDFEIVKVYREDSPLNKLNDFVEICDYQIALDLLDQYRKIGHNLKLYSLTLFVDGKKWKKFNFKY